MRGSATDEKLDSAAVHAAVAFVPATLLVGTAVLGVVLLGGVLQDSSATVDFGEMITQGVNAAAFGVVATTGLSLLLWIGGWWTALANAPLPPSSVSGAPLEPTRPAIPHASQRRNARALDAWEDDGGQPRRRFARPDKAARRAAGANRTRVRAL